MAEVKAARRNDVPSGGNGFALGGDPIAGGRLLFRDHDFFEVFLRKSLVGEKSKYWDSALNESTNLW